VITEFVEATRTCLIMFIVPSFSKETGDDEEG